jgi:hypothetical protein
VATGVGYSPLHDDICNQTNSERKAIAPRDPPALQLLACNNAD